MNKTKLVVPKGIEYLGDWKEFNFSLFPKKCILDKVIPGCGLTQYCLTGKENVILCSPRKMLLDNKKKKHKDDVYLVKNEYEVEINYDKNLTNKPDKSVYIVQNITKEESLKIYNHIYDEIKNYLITRFNEGNKPCKIMVTYDSYHIVKDILTGMGVFDSYYTIVDEMQTILHDAKFKSSTEIHFLETLNQSNSAIFTSATPMMEEYLDVIDEFKDLPYYKLDWITEDPNRLVKPDLKVLTMESVGSKCKEIINRYLDGNFETIRKINKQTGIIEEIISKEAVFYVNSVNHIINVINSCNLKPEQVNILCSDTTYNKKRMRARLNNKNHVIGTVPGEDEPNKMFTFCTRTVYVGADFYSKCARTFIFSDANINTLVVDISEDLAQILGRQRDDDNPWSNSANFYYITSQKIDQKEYTKRLEEKLKTTQSLLNSYNVTDEKDKSAVSNMYELMARAFNYRDNYVAVNSGGNPVLNKLAMIAEQRAYEIQKYDYADRFAIFNKVRKVFGENSFDEDLEMSELVEKYSSLTVDKDRLRLLCSVSADLMYRFINKYLSESDKIRSMFLILDQKKIRALGYNTSDINREINNRLALQSLSVYIFSEFKEGDHYSNIYLAEKLQSLYNKYGVSLKAKATDIKKWFETRSLKLQDKKENKRIHGLKLIKKL